MRHRTQMKAPRLVNIHETLPHVDAHTASRLARHRKGHKTVAIVGLAPSSCSLAPFEDERVEIWCVNEGHILPWLKRWDAWFQMHKPEYFQREIDLGGIRTGHYKWLQLNHGDRPIWMLEERPDVPNSKKYPLYDAGVPLHMLKVGDKNKIRFFHSSFDYMIALAILQQFTRIEIYGFEFKGDYENQRYSAYTWKGVAMGKGIQIYEPPQSAELFDTALYGYAYTTLEKGERVYNGKN